MFLHNYVENILNSLVAKYLFVVLNLFFDIEVNIEILKKSNLKIYKMRVFLNHHGLHVNYM